ncbi:acyltransferase domain-containing protein [Butyrivibrio sp. MC2013]|uniref:acyltransferase domain-containing protein n=1 Tax=Butyrivibrio sp. MC2013 TaxID=1280686 RepID=UPI000412B0E8|nr:acyltransferase domain-containing protein [Butyrivibrio sp. MC2013]
MEVSELVGLIELPYQMREPLTAAGEYVRNHYSEIEPYLNKLSDRNTMEEGNNELIKVLREDPGSFKILYCHLLMAVKSHDRYVISGIPDKIFIDTMKCFTRFAKECLVRNKSMYFDRAFWTYRQVSMNLFRLGELEYEICSDRGSDVISIHIPSDADLNDEKLDMSFKLAEFFFKSYFPSYRIERYICDSWLLSPALKELLGEDSGILRFQSYFEILDFDESNLDCLEWLFRVPAGTAYELLPEDTSLQRSVKQMLLGGRTPGAAYGVLRDRRTK